MHVEQLRRWVRGELDDLERREVGRWILRSTDADLPGILHGLIREHEDELADAAYRQQHPELSYLADLWRLLLEQGRALFEPVRGPMLAGGEVLGAGASLLSVSFRRLDEDVVVDVTVPASCTAALFATTDRGDEHMVMNARVLAAGKHAEAASWTPEAHEGRVTFWLVAALPMTEPERLTNLREAVDLAARGQAEIAAARWTDLD